jgi:T5orf172 domain
MVLILTDEELAFLCRLGVTAGEVYDARGEPQWFWRRRMRELGKRIAVGGPCKKHGHRLRTGGAHCVQCNTSRFGFQQNYRSTRYVYIAGSLSKQIIKIGNCADCDQREHQMRAEQYGGISDWRMLFSVKVDRAGEIEDWARQSLAQYRIGGAYWKDGFRQEARELLRCSFSLALAAVERFTGTENDTKVLFTKRASLYEFAHDQKVS